MRNVLLVALLITTTIGAAQRNAALDRRYFYHWESTTPLKINMEIIVHNESGTARVTEIKFDNDGKLGQGIVHSTVYVCKNRKGRMVVETINPSTLQIQQSEYVLTPDKKLLRVTATDTITFKRRY
jgi:hypothetical protein